MKKRNFLLKWVAGILVMLFLALALGIEAREIKAQSGERGPKRSDLIVIDTRPEVVFLHDLHTDALEKYDKGCTTCHLPEEPGSNRISPKFKQLKDIKNATQEKVESVYWAECLGCHKEMAAAGQKAGPVIWYDCTKEKVGAVSARQPSGFDKSLHFRHTKATTAPCQEYQWNKKRGAQKGNCGACHHEYDEKDKKLFYAKGKEGSCRYCHMKESEENRISMRIASHFSCIECHQEMLAKKEATGPYRCSGCHGFEEQKMIKKIKVVPRIKRNQPDVVLMKTNEMVTGESSQTARMRPVPFDHRAHEEYNDTCVACHHSSLDSCSKKCHTLSGAEDGKHINLERAMHDKGYDASCLGCHKKNQEKSECAACHTFMEKGRKQDCGICHMALEQEDASAFGSADEKMMASMLIQSRREINSIYKDEDIPEKVVIKALEDKYEPVELPHRKIVKTLFKNIKANKLASAFHPTIGTVCQGCHHHSPPDTKPPSCSSCHYKLTPGRDLTIQPGIVGAYHQQCMGCHKKLAIEKPKSVGCTDCHKEKKKIAKAN